MTASSRATSSARRAIGPMVSNVHATGMLPRLLTRPAVPRRPHTPPSPAGMRIDPAVSVPMVAAAIPAATAAPEPPEEPPAMRSRSHGLRQGP
jgi:hypothetical protein